MKNSLIAILFLAMASISNPGQSHHIDLPEGVDEMMATWLWGYYTVPASITRDGSAYWYGYPHTKSKAEKINNPAWTDVATGHIRPDAKAPAVLVMHGCAGLLRGPAPYRVNLMEKGYAVFEPDSFARPNREPCGEDVMDKRIEELGYAREMIRDLSWVDQERVYLMGISEGGAAVAAWGQPGFAAHIITLANCNGGRPKAPEGVPVLAIIGEKDDYYAGTSCNVIRKINGSRSMVIPDGLHAILDAPEVEQAIEEFLELQESS